MRASHFSGCELDLGDLDSGSVLETAVHQSHLQVVRGEQRLPRIRGPCTLRVVFDNTHSIFMEKKLSYHVVVATHRNIRGRGSGSVEGGAGLERGTAPAPPRVTSSALPPGTGSASEPAAEGDPLLGLPDPPAEPDWPALQDSAI